MTTAPLLRNSVAPMSDAEALQNRLAEDSQSLIKRQVDLIGAEGRLPDIDNDDGAGKASDYIKQVTSCAKALDTARVGAKEPFLEGGRSVDGFFKSYTDPLAALKKRVEGRLGVYLREKADKERRAREEEARIAAEAAAAREAETMKLAEVEGLAPDVANAALDGAVQAQVTAEQTQKAAEAKPADLARTRGDFGSLATLRREWTFKDMDRASLDLEALRAHFPVDGLERALRSFVKAGGREIKGAVIYEAQHATVR